MEYHYLNIIFTKNYLSGGNLGLRIEVLRLKITQVFKLGYMLIVNIAHGNMYSNILL